MSVIIFCMCGDSFKWLSSPIMVGSTPKYINEHEVGKLLLSVYKKKMLDFELGKIRVDV